MIIELPRRIIVKLPAERGKIGESSHSALVTDTLSGERYIGNYTSIARVTVRHQNYGGHRDGVLDSLPII